MITAADIAALGRCTGDGQAIHLSRQAALAAGLPGVVAHGMHTFAMCFDAVVDRAAARGQRLESMTLRFARPVLPLVPVIVQLGDAGGAVAVRALSRGRVLTRGGIATLAAARSRAVEYP